MLDAVIVYVVAHPHCKLETRRLAVSGSHLLVETQEQRVGDVTGVHIVVYSLIIWRALVVYGGSGILVLKGGVRGYGEDVVVVAVVTSREVHNAHDLCGVRGVIRRIALRNRMERDVSGDDVVHERGALSPLEERIGRKHHIVVNEAGAVGNLGPDVSVVVVEEDVAGYAGSNALPVKPEAVVAVLEHVVAYDHVNGGVQLDAANLGAGVLPLGVAVVDVVVLDD